MDYNNKLSVNNVLHWNYRGFTEFPLKCLKNDEAEITDIYLKENLISHIPSDIGKLYNLESLYLSGNDIGELPCEISKLICLKCLDVSGNRLRCVPEDIGLLANLKYLILDENELRQLPLRLAELRALRYLSVCDNQLQWISQRPVYNYYHCELRFWRNPTLVTIPYSLWYHMFRGQQTRSVNIKSLEIPKYNNSVAKKKCLIRVPNMGNVYINFPPISNTTIINSTPSPPSLLELSKRILYGALYEAAKRISNPNLSIYSDNNINNNNYLNYLDRDFSGVAINRNRKTKRNGNLNTNDGLDNKQYYVPSDIVQEHFVYLPSYIKNDLCNGPVSRCENLCCKKPVFDYAYHEFCLEKINLIDKTTDVILSATFCSKSCADIWKSGKYVLQWSLTE